MIGIINSLINVIANALTFFINLLPPSPLNFASFLDSTWLGWINYAFPVTEIIVITETYLIALGTYYLYRSILRWVKAVK